MLHIRRRTAGIAAAVSVLALSLPLSASAMFWSGFPFAPAPEGTQITLPAPSPVDLCVKTMCVAGMTIQVPRPCKDAPPPPPPQPTLTFTANPTTVEEGSSATLSWDSTNATSCTASGGWSGSKTVDGSESVTPSATTSYTLSCSGAGGSVSQSVTVTVTEEPEETTLTIVKTVINDDGGIADEADFQARIDGADVDWDVAHVVTVGSHTVSETSVAGYTAGSWGGDCASNGTVTLAAGEDKTCTITNDDQPGTLRVIKVVVNDNLGENDAEDFSFQVNGGTVTAFEADGQNDITVDAGTYSVAETAATGYTTTYNNCSNVVVSNGETETCTITNNDIAPDEPTLDFSATRDVVQEGSASEATTTLEWDSANATSCTASNGWTGGKSADGSEVVEPTGTTSITYVLECTGPGGTVSESVTITVVPPAPAPTLSMSASRTTINEGSESTATTTLTWDSSNVDSCTASGATEWTGAKSLDGSETVTPTADVTYELDCTSAGGDIHAEVTIDFVPEPQGEGTLVISEVLYDLATSTPEQGSESANEWVELYNGTSQTLDLSGYTIHDAAGSDTLPEGTTLASGAFMIITASSTTASFYDFPEGTVVIVLPNNIGSNGLANAGDHVELRNDEGNSVDAVSWGTDTFAFTPSVPVVEVNAGHSIGRIDPNTDTGAAADWEELETPTPGE